MTAMQKIYLLAALAPLVGAIIAGFGGTIIGRAGAHTVAIAGVLVSTIASFVILADVLKGNGFDGPVYTWAVVGGLRLEIGFLIDSLTALMIVVVSIVSLMVHIYTVGYMADDPGYQRFFAYISLFTFSMLMHGARDARPRRARAGQSNGYSTLWLADAVIETSGRVTTVEIEPDRARMAKENVVRADRRMDRAARRGRP